eukprot:CAMPEP_0177602772 /NCGR_PEP_ID=MMETSP0419_2-20121207/15085_1 /TAXON_ID=582737 /ORGANISM="Tetraselmis sp., Strain GSL018" /LENGTH=319 /DNA_ID=CAMNT_0019096355 /DNA_START=276 /DNA_END=1236 /DNA_ORIENTATION=+
MLPPSALRKRAMNFPVPTSVKKSAGKEVEVSAPSATSSDTLLGAVGTLSGINPKDEYDPARPNDYEEVRRERERLRQEAEAEADRQAKLKEAEERQAEEQRLAATRPPEQRESALKISGEEAFLRRGRIGRAGPDPAEGGAMAPPNPPAAEGGGMTAAQRMMEKMGWKAGQGLGKARQGMTTPLMAQKTDTHSAVIVNAEPVTAPPPGNPDDVVLLRNMVGPGEVDEQLEDEVAEECSKYGQVNRVIIFEVTEPGFPASEAVRIFVEFDRKESATKALVDLEGRFFGGRVVRATFFSEDRFRANDVAPLPEELESSKQP